MTDRIFLARFAMGPGALRLFLAAVVFFHHATPLRLGAAAVYVFFALSGYWIARMWEEKYRHAYGPFLVSRIWRLWPVFLICSGLAWAVMQDIPQGLDWTHEIVSSIAILGYQSLAFAPDYPAWSLDIELQFYLVAPLLVWAIARSRWALPALIVLSLAATRLPLHWSALRFLCFFGFGIAQAIRPVTLPQRFLWLPAAFLFAALLLSPWRDAVLVTDGAPQRILDLNDGLNVVLALALIPYGLSTAVRRSGARDQMFGDLSYTAYLLHVPVLDIVALRAGDAAHGWAADAAAFAATLVASYALWRLVDRPSNRLRAAWLAAALRRRTAATRAPAIAGTAP